MNVQELIEAINQDRALLSSKSKDHHGSCPLRVAMLNVCPASVAWKELWYRGEALNPDPDDASRYLDMEENFCRGISDAWDMNRLYGDVDGDSFISSFAGFLIGVSYMTPPKLLTE